VRERRNPSRKLKGLKELETYIMVGTLGISSTSLEVVRRFFLFSASADRVDLALCFYFLAV
jgi:hypothetical protein